MRNIIRILTICLLVTLSCSENNNLNKDGLAYSDFQTKLKMDMDYAAVVSTFGNPSKDAGSGIHIYVYSLNDFSELWIGFTDRILYAKHVGKDQKFIENLKLLNSIATITGPDLRMCACCGGWFIRIDNINYEFESLPSDAKIDLQTEKFPVTVRIDWQMSDASACPDKKILIQKITKL